MIQTTQVWRMQAPLLNQQADLLAEEVPIALVYNGISHVVLMATPQYVRELALGFSLSEGILQHASQLYGIELETTEQGISAHLEVASSCFYELKARRRSMSGRTGCGLCGIDSLAAAQPHIAPVARQAQVGAGQIRQALLAFDEAQPLRRQTGSLHSAAWVKNGEIQALYEDVGRHNALDKLIGYLALNQVDTQDGFALISSRASYEMVAKSAMAGIGCIVAVSAPTALTVQLAQECGQTLIAFARPQQQTIYTYPEYVALEEN